MSWHFTTIDDDSRNLKDPTESTVQSHGELRQTQIFVREVLQNALDNRADDSPVYVDFRLSYLTEKVKTDFLNAIHFDELIPHIKAVRDYQLETKKHSSFPDTDKILASNYVLKLLYIDDYGTRGSSVSPPACYCGAVSRVRTLGWGEVGAG